MIKIQNLTKMYGSKKVIESWNYQLETGKIYGLIGRNGIGKTTLMKCVSGLNTIDAGEIFTEQGEITDKDYLKRNIVYVSDDPVYYNDLTLYEHLWLICRIENYDKNDAKEKIDFYINKLNMEEYMYYYPTAMSKGTLQRMMLIMGFLRKDTNLLLDEPFNGLDPIQLQEVLKLCEEQKTQRCTIISSHDIESLGAVCDSYLIFTAQGIQAFTNNLNRDEINKLIGESYA